jgi:hypothetical protein
MALDYADVERQLRATIPKPLPDDTNPLGAVIKVREASIAEPGEKLLIKVPAEITISEYDPAAPLAAPVAPAAFCPHCGTASHLGHAADCKRPVQVQTQKIDKYVFAAGSWWCATRFLRFPWLPRPAKDPWTVHPALTRQGVEVISAPEPAPPRARRPRRKP